MEEDAAKPHDDVWSPDQAERRMEKVVCFIVLPRVVKDRSTASESGNDKHLLNEQKIRDY